MCRGTGAPRILFGTMHARARIIAMDGPVASGKSTVGRALAKRLGLCFLDTGVMYRAVTRVALDWGVGLSDDAALTKIAQAMQFDFSGAMTPDDLPVIRCEGKEISATLFAADVDRAVSQVSAVRGVRDALVPKQREIAAAGGIVMVGRDIGTVVLTHAPLKIYLWASVEERARRRYEERGANGAAAEYEVILADLRRRDDLDSTRALSPLTAAADAVVVETDGLTIAQVVERIVDIAKKAGVA